MLTATGLLISFAFLYDITNKTLLMVSHEIDYKIFGDDIQFVEIEIDPGVQPLEPGWL